MSLFSACGGQATDQFVQVRGARVSVPSDWHAVTDADSTVTLSPADGSDALRLTVIISLAPKAVDSTSAASAAVMSLKQPTVPIVSACGATARSSGDDSTVEDGRRVFLRRWFVAHATRPDTLRVAVATYAISADQVDTPTGVERLAMADSIVRGISFAEAALDSSCIPKP